MQPFSVLYCLRNRKNKMAEKKLKKNQIRCNLSTFCFVLQVETQKFIFKMRRYVMEKRLFDFGPGGGRRMTGPPYACREEPSGTRDEQAEI